MMWVCGRRQLRHRIRVLPSGHVEIDAESADGRPATTLRFRHGDDARAWLHDNGIAPVPGRKDRTPV